MKAYLQRLIRPLTKSVYWLRTRGRYLRFLVVDEFAEHGRRLSLRKRLWAWRRGFLSRSYRYYEFDKNKPDDYLSDVTRYLRTPFINGPYSVVLDNKLLFRDVFAVFPGLLPMHPALIRGAQVIPLESELHVCSIEDVLAYIRAQGKVVIKPTLRGGGEGVKIIAYDGGFTLNGRAVDAGSLVRLMRTKGSQVLVDFVESAAYAREIYPASVNTMRLLTMWDYEQAVPFIAIAVHRFGTRASGVIDNLSQGGLSAEVDLDSGQMGEGVYIQRYGELHWLTHHPESGVRIEGVAIPGWTALKARLLDVAQRFPHIPYIGWDLIVTSNGFKVIEGNNYSSMRILQLHRPLLADQRVRDFYAYHGVIP